MLSVDTVGKEENGFVALRRNLEESLCVYRLQCGAGYDGVVKYARGLCKQQHGIFVKRTLQPRHLEKGTAEV